MRERLLIVDDETGVVELLKSYFEMSGYTVYAACSGKDALKQAGRQPDLVLLDINMPDMDGLTVCETLRQYVACPVLFLTARVETADKIRGFQAGADDYIVKPFDMDELGARVAAHLRRENRRQERSVLRFFADMVIDYSRREITIRGEMIPLSRKEFDIVELLSVNAGQVFDRERIYERVWGYDGDGSSDTVMEHIRKIRAKFAAASLHSYIETVWGGGLQVERLRNMSLKRALFTLALGNLLAASVLSTLAFWGCMRLRDTLTPSGAAGAGNRCIRCRKSADGAAISAAHAVLCGGTAAGRRAVLPLEAESAACRIVGRCKPHHGKRSGFHRRCCLQR